MDIKILMNEFREKLASDTFTENDFAPDMRKFLKSFLTGKSRQHTREKFYNAVGKIFVCEEKYCVVLKCPDDDYRFDFKINTDGKWQICFIECITLPVHDITEIPYSDFKPYEKESWIRAEHNISNIVYQYTKIKSQSDISHALEWFRDGAGNVLAAESWVPFYNKHKAIIAYNAWYENRINGEQVAIDEFDDDICVIRFTCHLWRRVYDSVTHIKTMITHDEYMGLFESIWRDRAGNAGLQAEFLYGDNYTTIIKFTR